MENIQLVINALHYKKNSSGIGVCIRELFGRLASTRSCTVMLSKDSPDFLSGDDTVQYRTPWKNSQKLLRFFFQSIWMGTALKHNSILLTTDSKVPLYLPRRCCVMPLITDLAIYRLPETYQKSRVFLWKAQYRFMKIHVKRWLAISEYSKQDIILFLGIPDKDIDVVYMAASESFFHVTDSTALIAVQSRYALPESYILFVGNFNPRKNLERIIIAFDIFKERTNLPHKLVIAGEQGWKFDRASAMSGIRHSDDVVFVGFVPDIDMPALYSMADLFVFPTLYEGFGIPVIEAQQCGTPVLTSEVSALPEVAGRGAFYIDPYSVEDISAAIEKILTNEALSLELVVAGYENAKRFSWEASSKQMGKIIESVMTDGLHEDI